MKNDELIIREFKEGNKSVFEELIVKYKPYVYTICKSLVKNREDSEDITQDVFVKIYFSLNKYKGTSSLKVWIYKISYNTSMSFLYKKNRGVVVYDDINSDFVEDDSNNFNPFLDISDRELKIEILKETLNELKPIESLVLTLFYLKEQNINEICEITSLKNSNVRVILHRGRFNLLNLCNSKLNENER